MGADVPHGIVACASIKKIFFVATVHRIVTRLVRQEVVPRAASKSVAPRTSFEFVVAIFTGKTIGSGATLECVRPAAAIEG